MTGFYTNGRGVPKFLRQKLSQTITPFYSWRTALLVLVFVCFQFVCLAQESRDNGALKASDSIKPLEIGDEIPEELWEAPFQVMNHPEGKETITLNEYRGKLLILDFWASWCAPCVRSLRALDSIQTSFKDELAVLPITQESLEVVEANSNIKALGLPSIVNASILKSYFPHRIIPHLVWVGEDGIVKAITDHKTATRNNIEQFITGETLNFPVKVDLLDFKPDKPLFVNGNGGNGDFLLYRSLISSPIPGLSSMGSMVVSDTLNNTSRIYAINLPVSLMYQVAIEELHSGFPEKRVKFEVSDAYTGDVAKSKAREVSRLLDQQFCYELIMPLSPKDKVREKMVEELNNFFRISVGFERRKVECYVLKALPGINKSYSSGGPESDNLFDSDGKEKFLKNQSISRLWDYLNYVLELNVVDETKIDSFIDLQFLEPSESSIDTLKKELHNQGISIEKEDRFLDFFVITKH